MRLNTNLFVVAGAAVLMTLAGCRCQPRVSEDDLIPITLNSSRNIKLLWADSHLQDNKIIIHGAFRRQSPGSVPMSAHIDVQMLSPHGELLRQAQTPTMSVPKKLPGKGIDYKRFELELPNDGSSINPMITLTAHQGCCDV